MSEATCINCGYDRGGHNLYGNCPCNTVIGDRKGTRFEVRKQVILADIPVANPLDAKIKARHSLLKALDNQIIAVLNHCPDVEVREVIRPEDRENLTIIFTHVMNKEKTI